MINIGTSIIVPCFNEESVISRTYQRITKVLKDNQFSDYEMIFVVDGGNDRTLDILTGLAKTDKAVKVVSFSRNFGHQSAITAGINYCTKDIAIIIDADLQDPPELFPEMINLYEREKCNVIYGVRKTRKKEMFLKRFSAMLFYRIINYLSDTELPLDTGDFRLLDKSVIEAFKSFPERNKYIRGLISWMGFKQCPIYYDREPRISGGTKYTLPKMIKLASTGMFYFSKKPLQLALNLGFLSLIIAIFLVFYVFASKIYAPSSVIPGWASLLIVVIFFGGVQLLTIGILGQYIGNIFDEIKNRPQYIIEKKINL